MSSTNLLFAFRSAARLPLISGAVAAVALLVWRGMPASAAPKLDAVSTPQISMMLEPYTPAGIMRVYAIPNGASYWTNDLPIYQGDTVKLAVFVATGADELQELKVRVDNVLVADITKAPWTAELSTASLGAGYHSVEAWAQVSGPKPQFAGRTLTFFISPPAALQQPSAPTSQVKGQEQILKNGVVVNVPLDPGAPAQAAAAPPTPASLAMHSPDANAKVSIVLTDASTKSVINQAQPVQTSVPLIAAVASAPGSSARQFVYELLRGGDVIVAPSSAYPVDITDIRLQPLTRTTPGILPGPIMLWVWGVDAKGNYGSPVSAAVQIQSPAGD